MGSSQSLLVPDAYLQEVPPTTSHHSSLFAFKAIHHHHQVHMGILLSDRTITPNALYFVVCILREEGGRGTEQRTAEPLSASIKLSTSVGSPVQPMGKGIRYVTDKLQSHKSSASQQTWNPDLLRDL